MSSISSSKSGLSGHHGGGGKLNRSGYDGMGGYGGIGDDGDIDNPFRIPPDEKIFSFKEEEKDRKIEERDRNKSMKIWEKNRPTREGCLRRIGETDIEPSALAINPKVQKKINVGEAAGFTIPIERPKNKENRYKLIEKKREMFLVQQMLETKQREIQRLEDHAFMREDGLNCSEKMLAQDTNSFIAFFNDIKEKTQQANKEYETLKFKKAQKTQELRQINDEQTILVSGINKNLESLSIFYDYKVFLDSLASKEVQDEMERRKQYRRKRKEDQERRDAQFGQSQGRGFNNNSNNARNNQARNRQGGGIAGGGSATGAASNMKNDESEVQIPPKLKEVIEESDDEYPIHFRDPDSLLEIFSTLEEKNLFLIQQGQEAEHQLEEKKHEYDDLKQKFQIDIGLLRGSKSEIKTRIVKTDNEKNNLENNTQDQLNKALDSNIYMKIDQQVKELYSIGFADKAEGKMGNASVIQLLNEIEKLIDSYLLDFQISEQIDNNTVQAESTKIKKAQRVQNREETKLREQQAQEEKRRLKQEEKDKKQFVKTGKQPMVRSEKKKINRVKEVKKVFTEEQLDLKKYLEI